MNGYFDGLINDFFLICLSSVELVFVVVGVCGEVWWRCFVSEFGGGVLRIVDGEINFSVFVFIL